MDEVLYLRTKPTSDHWPRENNENLFIIVIIERSPTERIKGKEREDTTQKSLPNLLLIVNITTEYLKK